MEAEKLTWAGVRYGVGYVGIRVGRGRAHGFHCRLFEGSALVRTGGEAFPSELPRMFTSSDSERLVGGRRAVQLSDHSTRLGEGVIHMVERGELTVQGLQARG
jgi:hypothetical protein